MHLDISTLPPEKQWEYYRGCQTKEAYPNKRGARTADRESKVTNGSMHQYKCEFCGCWHNGHNRPKKAAMANKRKERKRYG